jgi:ribosomal protein S27AE
MTPEQLQTLADQIQALADEAEAGYDVTRLRPRITCPTCGRVSHHPKDVEERYCGNCHQWHDLMDKGEPR